MTLAPTSLSVEVGKTGTATLTVAPTDATDQAATVKSADETKVTATVSGKTVTVTGVAATTTSIDVTVTVGGKSKTLAVTVTAAA